jgi:hypothetical protein
MRTFFDYMEQKTLDIIDVKSLLCYTICMKKPNIKQARTCVYHVNYHIVWSVKYRRKVLTSEIERDLKDLFQEIAQDKGFEIVRMEVGEQDHLHVLPPVL